ncbi:MAG: hypothetical protein H7296_07480 [Bacteroidia bacterium]|nr:hypothetical protein [Bacteroidia bacterium]
MTVYEALTEMRELSAKDIPFSFSFMSYSRERQTSGGVVEVRQGKLRKRATVEQNAQAEVLEQYTDLDTLTQKRFYQPTLMTFNGITLNF